MAHRTHHYTKIRELRSAGLTYKEINTQINSSIPKSTLSGICKGIRLSTSQQERIKSINNLQLKRNRVLAVKANKDKFDRKLKGYRLQNKSISPFMQSRNAQLVALAMLYLGEGSKWKSHRCPTLGSTDPMIIAIYIKLLKLCYNVPLEKLRARIQHRADQSSNELLAYWSVLTGIPKERFYPCYVDKRTIGKPTTKLNYKGVCCISCPGTYIQLELQQIAVIISEAIGGIGAAG